MGKCRAQIQSMGHHTWVCHITFFTFIKIFLIKSESSLTLHRQQCNCNFLRSRNVARKDIRKLVHVTSVVQPQFYQATRILFVHKKVKTIIKMYSTILLPELLSSAVLESMPERNHVHAEHKQHRLRSASVRMLNVKNADYVLAMFLGLGTSQLHCCLCRVRKLSDFIKNILFC